MITKENILSALRNVEDPDLKKDIVSLNMVDNIEIDGNTIRFSVILTTPACPMKDMIQKACENAIKHFVSSTANVEVKMTARVTAAKSNNPALSSIKNTIVVASGKGGVGKSTVAVNLALSLAQSGAKVGMIDADIYGPSIPVMFGLEKARPLSVQVNGKNQIEPIEKYGIKVLSIGFFTDPEQAIPWRGAMVSTAIKQLFNDAHWGELDYLIVDTPPGTGDIHITLAQQFSITGVVLVTTPQKVALADAIKGANMFRMKGVEVPLLGVVENMSYFTPLELPDNKYYIFGQGGGKMLAEKFNIPLLGEIPFVMEAGKSGDTGQPIVLNENNPETTAFHKIAQTVAQQISIHNALQAE